ncbi:SagB/ThcOx family dehydrogenase [Halodesulfurarchaeum sp.]|uniref:SagB/ThcOx family dehydrogenase n=1 Tax=Halodesulfurarchaeum sp. TaxID=1980530 RepID=UPI002FC31DF4
MNAIEPDPGSDRPLPDPDQAGSTPLETTLTHRRSRREFGQGPISLADVSQLLWAAQGETHPDGLRTAPSAGATYPLVVRLSVAENGVPDLEPGVYRYWPGAHTLRTETSLPAQAELQRAAYDQEWVGEAPIVVAISGVVERTAREYGPRAGDLYVPMEAGHAGENLHLQAEAVGLATVPVGGFKDEAVASALDLGPERPLIMYPVGQRSSE